MTSTHAYRFTRSADGYAVGYLPTLDTITAGLATATDGRHLGTVRKVTAHWTATTAAGYLLDGWYSTRADAAAALLATADRVAEVEAIADAAEPEEVDADTVVDEVAARHGLPVPPRVTTRPVGTGLDEVALDGQTIGRTRDLPTGRVDAYTTTGTRIGENLDRDAAHSLLVEAYDAAPYSSTGRGPSRRAVREACARLSAGLTAAAPAIGAILSAEEPRQVAHLMGDDLLAACGSTGDALGLHVVPSSTPERVTCPACLPLLADEPGPEVDDPRDEPRPLEASSVAPAVEVRA